MINKNIPVKKRYWLRGGIVATIYVVYALIVQILIFERLSGRVLNENFIFSILGIIQWPLLIGSIPLFILYWIGIFANIGSLIQIMENTNSNLVFMGITVILVGALIGWLYGKIKERKK